VSDLPTAEHSTQGGTILLVQPQVIGSAALSSLAQGSSWRPIGLAIHIGSASRDKLRPVHLSLAM
jgi:hypothetical protein